MSIEAAFQQAQETVKQLPAAPDNPTKLRLYALFKQASAGDVQGERPGMGDFVARAKWEAWKALAGTPKEAAMQRYVDLVESLG